MATLAMIIFILLKGASILATNEIASSTSPSQIEHSTLETIQESPSTTGDITTTVGPVQNVSNNVQSIYATTISPKQEDKIWATTAHGNNTETSVTPMQNDSVFTMETMPNQTTASVNEMPINASKVWPIKDENYTTSTTNDSDYTRVPTIPNQDKNGHISNNSNGPVSNHGENSLSTEKQSTEKEEKEKWILPSLLSIAGLAVVALFIHAKWQDSSNNPGPGRTDRICSFTHRLWAQISSSGSRQLDEEVTDVEIGAGSSEKIEESRGVQGEIRPSSNETEKLDTKKQFVVFEETRM